MSTGIRLSIREEITPPVCSSCSKIIHPSEKSTTLYCPNCGQVLIWRCINCKKQGISYKCPNCGFEGP